MADFQAADTTAAFFMHLRAWSVVAILLLFGALAALTSVVQSAAAMFIWPWCVGYALFCILPWVVLSLRAADVAQPLHLPGWHWRFASAAWLLSVVASLICSPFAWQETVIWAGMPLSLAGLVLLLVDACAFLPFRPGFLRVLGFLAGGVSLISVVLWVSDQGLRRQLANPQELPPLGNMGAWLQWYLAGRNSEPLGHFNYTAGSALLFLPWLSFLAWRTRGLARFAWLFSALACVIMGISSGSRGGFLGLCVALFVFSWLVVQHQRRPWLWAALGGLVGAVLVFGFLHPVVRRGLLPAQAGEIPNLSNAERKGMVSVGWRAGFDRPWTGWGPGSVPLFYDRYRGDENFGAINMLQVHNTPLNLWAEGGLPMVVAAVSLLLLACRTLWQASRQRLLSPDSWAWPAAISLGGYAAFSLTDYQLDLPIIAFFVAADFGIIAHCGNAVSPIRARKGIVAGVACVALVLSVSFAPWLLARRAMEAREWERAISWLPHDGSLRIVRGLNRAEVSRKETNPAAKKDLVDQAKSDLTAGMQRGAHGEIAHFNLGWLELPDHPEVARRHFAADLAIAPSRTGAWLGLALSALALNEDALAIDCLAMEALGRPTFLTSGWWKRPELSRLRSAVAEVMVIKLDHLIAVTPDGHRPQPQARYFAALLRWMERDYSVETVIAVTDSPFRKALWFKKMEPQPRLLEQNIGTLAEWWRKHAEVILPPAQLASQLRAASMLSREEFIREALRPSTHGAFPVAEVYLRREGFAVRVRNPYARFARECAPQLRSPVAELFAADLLLKPGWIFDQELRQLAAPATRALVDAAR